MFAILSGCASITESKNQSMSVTTGEVTGAMCTLSNSKGSYYVTTPGSVMVRNACDQLAISCTKEVMFLLTLLLVQSKIKLKNGVG